jgi:moderate conductance mechanosensitive channel
LNLFKIFILSLSVSTCFVQCLSAHSPQNPNPQSPAEPAPVIEPQSGELPAEPQPGESAAEPTPKNEAGTKGSYPETASTDPNESEDRAAEELAKGISDAERIAELTDSIESDKQQIADLQTELDNPESEYGTAEREFRDLDKQLDETKEALEKAIAEGTSSSEAIEELNSDIERLTTLWKLAKDRFDLAIEDRKTLKEQLYTLKQKLERSDEALRELTEGPEPTDADSSKQSKSDDQDSDDSRDSSRSDSDNSDNSDNSTNKSKDSDDDNESMSGDEEEEEEEKDEELIQAEQDAEVKEAEAKEAQEETLSIEARLKDLQLLIAQEQKELNSARKKVDLATAAQHELSAELNRQTADGADATEINSVKSAIAAANQRFIKARSEVTEVTERLNDHRAELNSLQSEHIIALSSAERKRQEALLSEQNLEALKNPYTIRNITQWLLEHGPRLVLICIGMFVISRASSVLANRSVDLVSKGSIRGSTVERENRAKTLVGVFQNAATVGIFITGTLMILEELGANITVLMGGVAVIGLAVAFGAQNLIKDYFYGFVMLLENQYMLNDTIRIGGVTGHVERITLRMTVLRDSSGVVHFIPNGTINSVSNETHGWSRAICDIGISHLEDLDDVVAVLRGVSAELQADEKIAPLLLETPSEPSIEGLGGPIIALKLSVKTAPNKQGTVKQEWYKRIKTAFQEAGIAAPYSDCTPQARPLEIKKAA